MPEIWVPSIRTVCEDDPTMPLTTYEQPPDTMTSVVGGALSMEDRIPGRETSGFPLHSYWLINVRDEDVKKFKTVIPENEVPEEARLMVAMAKHCNGGRDYSKADAFFDEQCRVDDDADRKRALKNVLLQAIPRGLDPAAADAVILRHDLPTERRTIEP